MELKQKATVRTAVITDESTGHEYKVEGKRILFHHMNDMLNALTLDEDDDHETAVVAAETTA